VCLPIFYAVLLVFLNGFLVLQEGPFSSSSLFKIRNERESVWPYLFCFVGHLFSVVSANKSGPPL